MRRSLLLGMIVLALVAVLAGKAWSALACIVFDMGPVQNGEMYFVDYYDPENCNVEPEARYWIDIAQLDPQDCTDGHCIPVPSAHLPHPVVQEAQAKHEHAKKPAREGAVKKRAEKITDDAPTKLIAPRLPSERVFKLPE